MNKSTAIESGYIFQADTKNREENLFPFNTPILQLTLQVSCIVW